MNKFKFDGMNDFDIHIRRSIPMFEDLHGMIINIGQFYIKDNSNILDLGCTTGKLASLISKSSEYLNVYGLDTLDIRDQEYINDFKFIQHTLCDNHPIDIGDVSFDLIISNFTLQFIKKSQRQAILLDIFSKLNTDGCFIITEKTVQSNGINQMMFDSVYMNYKISQYFSVFDITEKQNALRGVLMPITSEEIEHMLTTAGFKLVRFYQALNFIGWICTKY